MSRKECPRAKSFMTPCYLRDGDMVIVEGLGGIELCVGCEVSINTIKAEQEREAKNERPQQ